jgi:hypothetical protein
VRVIAHQQPVAAVTPAHRLADPCTEGEPDFPVLLGLEVELVLVADLAEQPGVERDQLERLRERESACLTFDLGQRAHGVAFGIDELFDDQLGLTTRARGKPIGALPQLGHRLLEPLFGLLLSVGELLRAL